MYSFIRVPSCVKGRASDSQGTRIPTWWSRQWQWKGVGWDVFCPGAGLSKPSWGASNQSGVETKLLTGVRELSPIFTIAEQKNT